jgi:nucleoid DNA-binding protein
MIKADIVKRLSEEISTGGHPLKDKDALVVVDNIIESVKEVIIRDGRLEIRDFGVFQIKRRKARIGRNPKNKKPYPIPAHHVVTFKPGKQIRDLPISTPDGEGDDVD